MNEITLESKVTLRQAYKIMFDYLEGYYDRTGQPSEIGGLLSQLTLWNTINGKEPMDGAVFPDWLKSASRVVKDEEAGGYPNIDIKLS